MTTRIQDDLLDAALSRLQKGEAIPDLLVDYPGQADTLRPLLSAATMLRAIEPVQRPTGEELASNRNDYLAQISDLQGQQLRSGPVSPHLFQRLKGWITNHLSLSPENFVGKPKEKQQMSILFAKVAVIFAIVFASLGGTVIAAAESLPNSAAYPLKLAMEQARLSFENDPANQASMHLAFAHERSQEMIRLAAKGEKPDEALLTRMRTHLHAAYKLAAKTGDEQLEALLTQAQVMTQANGHELLAKQEQARAQIQEYLQLASGIMYQWSDEAESGLQDPGQFRWRFGPGGPCGGEACEPPSSDQAQYQHRHGPGDPPCSGEECEAPFGKGDQEQHQHQYGPGDPPCSGEECEPPFGEGDQEQHQHQYGPGDPPCSGEECEPPYGEGDQEQHQHQYGPGDPPCANEECEPPLDEGEQEQYRHQYASGNPPCSGEECEAPQDGGDQAQNQDQNQNNEQNQGQSDTQNQNQEQNNEGSSGQQSGGSGNSDGSNGSGGSGDSGGSDNSGNSGDSDGSGSGGGGRGNH